MLKKLKYIVAGIVIAGVLASGTTYAQMGGGISTPSFFKKVGNAIVMIKDYSIGSSSDRISKVWTDDLDAVLLTISGVASGDIDMDGNDIVNIGHGFFEDGTDSDPSITFTDDTDTGFYRSANNQFRAIAGGNFSALFSGNIMQVNNILAQTGYHLNLMGNDGDGATAVGIEIGNNQELVTAGGKLVSFQNDDVEKAYVDYLGSFNAGAGTNNLPAYSFVGDPNTGLYSPTGNQIAFSLGGSQKAKLTASGFQVDTILPTISVPMTVRGLDADGATAIGVILNASTVFTTLGAKLVSFQNNEVEKSYIDKDGQLIVGGSSYVKSSGVYGVSSYSGSGGFKNVTASLSTSIQGRIADGAGIPGVTINNSAVLATAGDKILSIQNEGVEKAYVDYLGGGYFGSDTTVSGTLQVADGTVTVPSISFSDDVGTGICSPSNNTMSFSLGGSAFGGLTSSGWFGNAIQPVSSVGTQSFQVNGRWGDSASAVSVVIGNWADTAYTMPGAKILSLENGGVEKAYIDYLGGATFGVGNTSTTTVSIGATSGIACLKMQDTDGAGFTYITSLNGVLTASTDSCE